VNLVKSYDLNPHLYANDTQIYGFSQPATTDELQSRVSQCIYVVGDLMSSNHLQLNTSKTEVLWCTSGHRQHQLPTVPLVVGNDTVPPVSSVRNLGIYVDADLSMRTHVLKTTSGCFAVLIIIIITTTIFIVLSSTAPAICESSLCFIWAKVGQRQVAANSQAKLQT